MKLHSFVVSVAIISIFKRFESLRSACYNDTVHLLYEKLRIKCLFRSDSCTECFTWRSSNIFARTCLHIRVPHT